MLQTVNEAGEWEDLDPEDCVGFDLQGLVYEDGSADVHVISELRRAGWGLVQVGPTGAALKRAYGPVPRDLPQTAYIAEWCDYSEVDQLAQGPTQPHQDCLNVVKALLKPVRSQLRWSNKAADFLREALRPGSGRDAPGSPTPCTSSSLGSGAARRRTPWLSPPVWVKGHAKVVDGADRFAQASLDSLHVVRAAAQLRRTAAALSPTLTGI